MKKFSVKSLLVLVLVLVLVLSIGLVACNKKDDGGETPQGGGGGGEVVPPTPGPDDPQSGDIDRGTYFTNLWEVAKDIGSEAISANDNVALALDLSVEFGQAKSGVVENEIINLGIKLDVVLDRNEEAATNSAVRALLYDGKSGETLCAIYYFLAEPNFLYIDLAAVETVDSLAEMEMLQGRYYKVAFVTDGNDNASYAGSVADFINNHKFMGDEEDEEAGFTIADVVDALVKDTGADWDLNKLVENIAGVFELDLKTIMNAVSLIAPNAYDPATGEIHLEEVLASTTIQGFIGDVTTTEKDGRKEYSTTLQLSSILGLSPDGMLPDSISSILNKDTEFVLAYGEKAGKIDGFALTLGLKSLKDAETSLYPQVKVAINNLELRKVEKTAAAAKARVEFDASKFAEANTIDLNTLCQGWASIEVELFKNGDMTPYRVTAYSDIDPIDTIIKIVKMCDEKKTNAERADLIKETHFEIGCKVEELDEDGELTGNVPFQALLSAPKGEASIVIGEKTYVLDIYDIVKNLDSIIAEFSGSEEVEDNTDGLDETNDNAGSSADGGVVDILQAIKDVIDLIGKTVKVNGEEISMDAIKGIFFDENGELKENWHEFTLDANFTKEIFNEICAKFGAENANEVSINIQKTASAITARAEYLNKAGVDAAGKDMTDKYFVEVKSSWDLEDNEFAIELQFNMWDNDANKKVTYDCKYEGALVFDEIEATEEEPAYKLLKSGNAKLSLTRQYDEENSIPESIFVATLDGRVNYNEAKDSITNASLALVVAKDNTAGTAPYFDINGTLIVSGTGKVLVKFVDGRPEYSATDGAIVDTTITETLLEWIGQLDVDQDGESVQIKDYKLPESVLSILQNAGLVPEEVTELSIGELLAECNIKLDDANVIGAHYEKSVLENVGEIERFTLGLNESEDKVMHLSFEFRRDAEGKPTYIKCAYDLGEGDNGLAVRLDSFDHEFFKAVPADKKVAAVDRTGENVNLLNSENCAETISSLMQKVMSYFSAFVEQTEEEVEEPQGTDQSQGTVMTDDGPSGVSR